MADPHVTVIGAGIVGVCCALHLQRKGFRVTLIDRQEPGEATSYGNACMITDSSLVPLAKPGIAREGFGMLLDRDGPLSIRAAYAPRIAPWLWRFWRTSGDRSARAGAAALGALLKGALAEHHVLADNTPAARWISDEPSLFLYPGRADFDAEAYAWELRRASGVRFELVDASALRALEPAVSERYRLAAMLQDHGRAVDPSRLTKAHAEWLQRGGGECVQREVRAIECAGGRATRLLTVAGPLELDRLVIAAGAWSARLVAQLGDTVPLESEGGYHVTLSDPGIELHHPLMDSHAKVAIAPMAQGIRIAGMVEFGGLRGDVPPRRCKLLLKLIRRILPGIRTEQYREWRGNRPSLPDSLPVIGRASRIENVWYAFGNQHVGLSSGPKTGRLIAQLVAGEPTAIDLAPFRVERF
jgi:D-amino-acid dehydrogenase